ncbi:Permease of the major facilitator superfamily [Phaffia rhodozyma]|uniref:Permease of the major facilitator superfamily n=1 Tax=Phaffia rhodozyma TaxID=264483 RepID=A0A0F7SNX8_PHARH|nr:Permease of the major facilitator superfamily [Phaffia rhodozyma]
MRSTVDTLNPEQSTEYISLPVLTASESSPYPLGQELESPSFPAAGLSSIGDLSKDIENETFNLDGANKPLGLAQVYEGDQPGEYASTERVQQFKLYKRRWAGLSIILMLDVINSMNAFWFTAIASESAERFNVTQTKINWFVNICSLCSLVTFPLVPVACHKYLPRKLCVVAAIVTIVASWIRYAACVAPAFTAEADRHKGWGLVLFSQMLYGLVGPLSLAIGSKYSELWFDVKERTAATMLLSIGAPLGTAIAQIIAPIVCTTADDIPFSVLVMGAISSLTVLSFIIPSQPPIPPTFSASVPPISFVETSRLYFADVKVPFLPLSDKPSTITKRERIDLWLLTFVFGTLTATITAVTSEVNSIFVPYGYSSSAAGNIAAIVAAGLVGAFISAPIIDRYLMGWMCTIAKVFTTIIAFANLGFLFAVKPDNVIGIVALFCLMGGGAFSLLAIGLELGAEVTRQPDTSSSAFYWVSSLFTFVCINIMDALRAGPEANPPYNMKNSLIFEVVMTFVAMGLVYFIRGNQSRSAADNEKLLASKRPNIDSAVVAASARPEDEEKGRKGPSFLRLRSLFKGKA